MRTASLFSGIALSISLVAGGVATVPAFAQTSKSNSGREVTQGMSIPQVQEKLTALGYRNIDRIKRDHNVFEVKASDRNGGRVKLDVDAQTGEIINKRAENQRRAEHDQRNADAGDRTSADCSKRRCRDDQPQQNAAATPTGK